MDTYTINGRKYQIKGLTLGQLELLLKLFYDLNIDTISATNLILKLGSNITKFLAIILVPDGVGSCDEIEKRIEDMKQLSDIDVIEKVVSDFFGKQEVTGILQRFVGIITEKIPELLTK